jgi:hypothetical protein
MSPSIFLGLVTHKASRFTEATTDSGLIKSLDRELRALGVETTMVIHDEDRYTPELLELTPKAVRESIDAELRTEREWRLYLDPALSRPRLSVEMLTRRLYRRLKLAPPWKRTLNADDPGAKMLRRLINIELAHEYLLEAGMQSQADWVLVAEDDAVAVDQRSFAQSLEFFANTFNPSPAPKFVNLSESFSDSILGVDHLMTSVGAWPGTNSASIESSSKPITNTVCAILYRGSFLAELLASFQLLGLSPVIPIDWKLNRAILAMHKAKRLGDGDCFSIRPAPLIQGSMMSIPSGGV